MIRRFFSKTLYPLLLFGAVLSTWLIESSGMMDIGMTTASVALVTMALIFALERIMPYSETWKPTPQLFWLDSLHSVVSSYGMSALMRATILAFVVVAGSKASTALGSGLWPSHWPLPLQLLFAVLLGDLGAYSAHRSMHLFPLGWRIHAVHHSTERMHFMAGGRTHPFNSLYNIALETGPVLFLGITPEVFMLMTVWKAVNGLLQHSNIDMQPGWLSYVLATNEVHWWHHSKVREESERNFGNSTMIWDHVFRSFFLPTDRRPRLEVGIDNASIPENYWQHLATPFILPRFEHPEPAPPA